jgi:hypothetical protein
MPGSDVERSYRGAFRQGRNRLTNIVHVNEVTTLRSRCAKRLLTRYQRLDHARYQGRPLVARPIRIEQPPPGKLNPVAGKERREKIEGSVLGGTLKRTRVACSGRFIERLCLDLCSGPTIFRARSQANKPKAAVLREASGEL